MYAIAKLYYLRDRSGKSARIREKLSVKKKRKLKVFNCVIYYLPKWVKLLIVMVLINTKKQKPQINLFGVFVVSDYLFCAVQPFGRS